MRPARFLGAAAIALLAFLVTIPPTAMGGSDTAGRAGTAVGFIVSQQKGNGSIPAFSPVGSTADAVLAMVAAGRGSKNVARALSYLERQVEKGNVAGVGLQAKVLMAAVAGAGKPRSFGGENLVRAIRETEQPDGRFGQDTAVFDDALAVLALAAAGREPSENATTWLAAAQCDDGGWQYDQPADQYDDAHCLDQSAPQDDFFQSDTNTTSLVVQALRFGTGSAAPVVDPFVFFEAMRDEQFGGWGYTWGFETTDANSTALVIQAYVAAGEKLPDDAMTALKSLQYRRCGAWAFTWVDDGSGGMERSGPDLGATIGAVLGVLRAPLPVPLRPVDDPAPSPPSCP